MTPASNSGTGDASSNANPGGGPFTGGTDPGTPLQVALEDAMVVQGGKVAFNLLLSRADANDVTVTVKTTAGTAIPGVDYVEFQGSVVVPAGQKSIVVNVQTLTPGPLTTAKQFKLDGLFTSTGQFVKASATGTIAINPAAVPQVQISVGSTHFCALKSPTSLYCWGENSYGQLGTGNTANSYANPILVSGIADAKSVSVRYWNSCILTNAGTALCWGWNQGQQLQPGAAVRVLTPTDIAPGVTGIKQVSLGYGFTCILTAQDTVMCKGLNNVGQLGNGTTTASSTFVAVQGLTGIKKIFAGSVMSCALTSQNTVKCWGSGGTVGYLGNGTTANSSVPVDVLDINDAIDIQVGYTNSCVLTSAGLVKCWGYNFSGELGNGTNTSSAVPVTVTGLIGVKQLGVGDHNNCAITAQNTVKCWGSNAGFALGNSGGNISTPVEVANMSNVTGLYSGGWHNCTQNSTGTLQCWGEYAGPTGTSIAIPRAIAIP